MVEGEEEDGGEGERFSEYFFLSRQERDGLKK